MSEAVKLNVKSQDHLNGNKSLYAHKARRKKIALIAIEVANGHSEDVRLELGATKLVTGQRSYSAEPPKVIIRKLSEFTWDFLLFAILAFDPVLLEHLLVAQAILIEGRFLRSGQKPNRVRDCEPD